MIKENKIIFGYGTILVHSTITTLELWHIDPQAIVGESITREFEKTMTIIKKQPFIKLYSLKNKLMKVSEANSTFEHEGYIFDFSHYNEKSIKTVLKGVNTVIQNMQLALAC